jgi:hypothetical protein
MEWACSHFRNLIFFRYANCLLFERETDMQTASCVSLVPQSHMEMVLRHTEGEKTSSTILRLPSRTAIANIELEFRLQIPS